MDQYYFKPIPHKRIWEIGKIDSFFNTIQHDLHRKYPITYTFTTPANIHVLEMAYFLSKGKSMEDISIKKAGSTDWHRDGWGNASWAVIMVEGHPATQFCLEPSHVPEGELLPGAGSHDCNNYMTIESWTLYLVHISVAHRAQTCVLYNNHRRLNRVVFSLPANLELELLAPSPTGITIPMEIPMPSWKSADI